MNKQQTNNSTCKSCGKTIQCEVNHNHKLDEYYNDDDGGYYYSCGDCITEGCGALGSIVHWCEDMFGMVSGEPKLKDDEIIKAFYEVVGKQSGEQDG